MNILVAGSGGREHAIAWALAKSPSCVQLFVAPGNAGTADVAQNVGGLNIMDAAEIMHFVREHEIDLVVIGPEAPLVAGVADALRAQGVAVFGPDAALARLEGSKSYSKQFMAAHEIPTARAAVFSTCEEALCYVREQGAPIVIKADGLAAGKGVVVAATEEAAEEAVRDCFSGAFGEAGKTVLVEECMEGSECSLLAFVANGQAFCMPAAQDHKRAFDGDRGPNTGGMGAYSPVSVVSDTEMAAMQRIMQNAAQATLVSSGSLEPSGSLEFSGSATAANAFSDSVESAPSEEATSVEAASGVFSTPINYGGVLYGGFMLTQQGPKIVEFNVRFGDPETQAVLPRFEGDLAEVMYAVAQGNTDDIHLTWSDKCAVCVVLASGGYPGAYKSGKVILGVEEAEALEDVIVFHAGTARNADGELISAGGRVLNVVALGNSFEEARERAYEACDLINFEGKQLRTDIGARATSTTS